MPNNNQTIEYKQLLDNGEPFYPMVGKSSYEQWVGYEEIEGQTPENFVLPVSNGGTGADNADDAKTNLGITDRTIRYGNYAFNLSISASSGVNQTLTYETLGIPTDATVLMVNIRQYHSGTSDDVFHSIFFGWSYDNSERKVWLRAYSNRSNTASPRVVVDYIYANGLFNAHG